jgi:hypothetical protein
MLEDGPGGGGAEDDGDDAPVAAAAWAVEDVGAERPAQELDLKAEIYSLDSKLLPDLYKEQAHEVRLVGNDAAHGR